MSARSIAEAVSSGERSAEEVVAAALARIADTNATLNAFVHVDADKALSEARAVDRRVASGERLTLAGIPVGVKDNIWATGQEVAQGSRLFADFRPTADAVAVERLRRNGAVIVGMTNAPEFASKGHTNSPYRGLSRHPLNPALTPGGSSGGSAVAVASGMVPLALGTDAGGSTRRPAAHVGICGFKPTYGAIPYGPGFAEPPISASVIGLMAESVDDIALAFESTAGMDPRDPDSMDVPAPAAPALRVAYSPLFGMDTPIDGDVADAIATAVTRLSAADVTIVRKDPVWPDGASEAALMAMHFAGLAVIHGEAWRRTPDLFDPEVAAQVEHGFSITGQQVAAGRLMANEIANVAARFFADVDILIGPTTPCVAWPADEPYPAIIGGSAATPRGHAMFTPFFNHARTPALSIPCGRGRDNLPVGLQIVAARGNDRMLLDFARKAEAILA